MFGLGLPEIAIILVVALIVLGPSKLPELARGLGKGLREFRKATEDFKSTMEEELHKPDPVPPSRQRAGYHEEPAQLVPPQQHAVGAPAQQPLPAPQQVAQPAQVASVVSEAPSVPQSVPTTPSTPTATQPDKA